jgi:hypothetical protein
MSQYSSQKKGTLRTRQVIDQITDSYFSSLKGGAILSEEHEEKDAADGIDYEMPQPTYAMPEPSIYEKPRGKYSYGIPHSYDTPHEYDMPHSEYVIPHGKGDEPRGQYGMPHPAFDRPHPYVIPHEYDMPHSEYGATPHGKGDEPRGEYEVPDETDDE